MWEQLITAIKKGNITEAKKLIQELEGKYYNWFEGIKELDRIDNNGNTALTWAVYRGLDEVCKMLISRMSTESLNVINQQGHTALMWSLSRGMEEICKMLISLMSTESLTVVDEYGDTALIGAAYKGWDEVCKMLISKMSIDGLNTVSKDGNTALTLAIKNGHNNIVEMLKVVTSQANIDNTANAPAQRLDSFGRNESQSKQKVVEAQVENKPLQVDDIQGINNGAKFEADTPEVLDKSQDIPMLGQLLTAIKNDDMVVARKIIVQMNKQELTAVDDEGKTALHWAAERDNDKIVISLLEKNPSLLNIEDNSENTALFLAKIYECQKVLSVLSNFTNKASEKQGEQLAQVQVEATEEVVPLEPVQEPYLLSNMSLADIVSQQRATPYDVSILGDSYSEGDNV